MFFFLLHRFVALIARNSRDKCENCERSDPRWNLAAIECNLFRCPCSKSVTVRENRLRFPSNATCTSSSVCQMLFCRKCTISSSISNFILLKNLRVSSNGFKYIASWFEHWTLQTDFNRWHILFYEYREKEFQEYFQIDESNLNVINLNIL